VPDKPVEQTPAKGIRAIFDWLVGSPAPTTPVTGELGALREGVPSRIGHYAIDRKLGEGGMGVVYAARDERLQRRVALKTMGSLASDETARQRFWREARAAASVNHPNICQIYEIGEDGGELFIASEAGCETRPHPIFGWMSEASWMRWAYLHTDHHLRQFGA